MKSNQAVIVTGSNGGIGTAICAHLREQGYFVLGIDINDDKNDLSAYICLNLKDLSKPNFDMEGFEKKLSDLLGSHQLIGLVNNAAVQILGGIDISLADFQRTMEVNLYAPFVLSQLLFEYLKINNGSIVNIGSIHSKLTKKRFVAYATSKSALEGLTKSLAVDCGEHIRVNAIAPAAINTEMLLDGFDNDMQKVKSLAELHPVQAIGGVEEVALAVSFLLDDKNKFLNGSVLSLDGGISSKLNDFD